MSLADRCSQEFEPRDWRRGVEYFQRGSVFLVEQRGSSFYAEVEGSAAEPYEVMLDWSEVELGSLIVECSCPRFADGANCKHIAAAILKADAAGVRVPGRGSLSLDIRAFADDRLDDPDDEYAIDGDDDDEWNDFGKSAPGAAPRRGGLAQAIVNSINTIARQSRSARRPGRSPGPSWKQSLDLLRTEQESERRDPFARGSGSRRKPQQLWFGLDVQRTMTRGLPYVGFLRRNVKKNGTFGKLTAARLSRSHLEEIESTEDRTLVDLLLGNEADTFDHPYYGSFDYGQSAEYQGVKIARPMFELLLPKLAATGRFGWLERGRARGDADTVHPLAWDDGPPWQFQLEARRSADGRQWELGGRLVRGEAKEELESPLVLMKYGLVIFRDRIARLAMGEAFPWIKHFRDGGPLRVPVKQRDELLAQLVQLPAAERGEWPDELHWEEIRGVPQPRLTVSAQKEKWRGKELECRVEFMYGEWQVGADQADAAHYDSEARRVVRRDAEAETAAIIRLLEAGAKRETYPSGPIQRFLLPPKKLPALVQQLTLAGWNVEAEGRLIRRAGELKVSVTSGIDWFDLEATCDFDGASASLPKLLEALRRGQQFVELDDGSHGMLPDDWLRRYAPLAELGQTEGDRLRFVPVASDVARRAAGGARASECKSGRSIRAAARPVAFVRGSPAARATRDVCRRAAALPARRLGLASFLAGFRLRRLSGRRYGSGEDDPSFGAARRTADERLADAGKPIREPPGTIAPIVAEKEL